MATTEFVRTTLEPDKSSRQRKTSKQTGSHRGRFGMFALFPLTMFLVSLASAPVARANDIYVAQNGVGSGNGADCADALPYTYLGNSGNWSSSSGSGNKIGPGTTVHVCGTITLSAGATFFAFQSDGVAGSPITLTFEANAVLQAPYFSAQGGIIATGRNYIVIDGGSNGVMQNTANGDSLSNQQDSNGITAAPCNNCTVRNLRINNIYVHKQNGRTAAQGLDQTQMRAIQMGGSNWSVNGNTIHDCGWCVEDFWGNGDTNIQVFNNEIYNMDHGFIFAGSASGSASHLFFHDNRVHDTANWDSQNLSDFHHDGIHTFTSGANASISQIYVYNNYFYGSWGQSPTGFIFVEGGSGTPSHMSNSYWWNNVFIVPQGAIVNTNGWVGIFSGDSGETVFVNNTFVGPNSTDNTACYNLGVVNNLTFENNVVNQCGDGIQLGALSGTSHVDYNFYGNMCQNGANCFTYNSSFLGSFSAWKSATGFDAHSVQASNIQLNADGSPLGNFTLLNSLNLGQLAAGDMGTLQKDTSKGNTRAMSSRPPSGGGSWVAGAYNLSGTTSGNPSAPSGLVATVQ